MICVSVKGDGHVRVAEPGKRMECGWVGVDGGGGKRRV